MEKSQVTEKRFCQHCGQITIFAFSNSKERFYCTICGNIFEGK